MNALFAFLIARWALSFLGTALLAALLWVFGPFLSFLEAWEIRLGLIILMFAVWAGTNLWLDWRRRRRDAVLTEGVAAAPAEEFAEAARAPVCFCADAPPAPCVAAQASDATSRAAMKRSFLIFF